MKTESDDFLKESQETLEARIVALTLGQVSDFERADLEREVAKSPQLAAFARDLGAFVRLTQAALAPPGEQDLRLSEGKRTALRERLGLVEARKDVEACKGQTAERASATLEQRRALRQGAGAAWWTPAWAIAACLVVAAGLLALYLQYGGVPFETGRGRSVEHFSSGTAGSSDSLRTGLPGARGMGFPASEENLELSKREGSVAGVNTAAPTIRPVPAAAPMSAPAEADALSLAASPSATPPSIGSEELARRLSEFKTGWGADRAEQVDAKRGEVSTGASEGRESLRRSRMVMAEGGPARALGDEDKHAESRRLHGVSSEMAEGRLEQEHWAGRVAEALRAGEYPAKKLSKDARMDRDRPKDGSFEGTIAYGSALAPLSRVPSELQNERMELQHIFDDSALGSLTLFQHVTSEQASSTFSLHVADVSFQATRTLLLEQQTLPDPMQVRVEEFTAAFDYGDPAPTEGEPVTLAQDQSRNAFVPEANLLRLSLRTQEEGRLPDQKLHLFLLIDRSGSMERPDRAGATRVALQALADKLRADDLVTVLAFDRRTRLVADRIAGTDAAGALGEMLTSVAESGTNLEGALAESFEIFSARLQPGAAHRMVVVTDGIANLGVTLPEALAGWVTRFRGLGVPLDVVAVGARDHGWAALEAMAQRGDGRFFFVEHAQADVESFAGRLAGAFRPAARDLKLQVRFNPRRVVAWSLLGFERHLLREEDFRDDTVEAAELSAAEQGSALYHLKLDTEGSGEVGQVWVRFEDTSDGQIKERSWVIRYDPMAPGLIDARPGHQLAVVATLFAERLRGSQLGNLVDLSLLAEVEGAVRSRFAESEQVRTLFEMIRVSRSLMEP